jgi:hypothetical protein
LPGFPRAIPRRAKDVIAFSSVTHEGVDELLEALVRLLDENLPAIAPQSKRRGKTARPVMQRLVVEPSVLSQMGALYSLTFGFDGRLR